MAKRGETATFEGTTLGARCGKAAGDSEENIEPEARIGPEVPRGRDDGAQPEDKKPKKIPMSMEQRMDGRQQG